MPCLFISLGTSPAIVPEAFLFPDVSFDAVHVLTTEKPEIAWVREWFRERAPWVRLTISRVDGFSDFKSEEEHFHFEEVLYRWIIAANVPPSQRFISLAGGFKTMSAAMQKAAAVLGAAEVFHVLCNLPLDRQPRTAEQIDAACEAGHLQWIRLGPESGWPQFAACGDDEYPLVTKPKSEDACWISAPDHSFRKRLAEVVERSHRIAGHWEQISDLPFAELATVSPSRLAWLNESVSPVDDRDWVTAFPKIDLHCHLGGFATHGPELAAVRAAATDPAKLPPLRDCTPPLGWPTPVQPSGLEPYRRLGDNNGSGLLRDPGCLREQCTRLYTHFVEQNIRYAEVRCSPANYATPLRSPWQVLADIRAAFAHAMAHARPGSDQSPICHVNLILIGTRQTTGDYRAGISRHLALALAAADHWTDDDACRVVGVDLAGFEDPSTRAHYFREEFTGVHRCGLALTVHAGENDDAEGVWRAVFDLNARRLGHALALRDSPELLRSVAARAVAIEMCPYANLQIKGFPIDSSAVTAEAGKQYPLLDYIRAGVRATVNTDNIGISAATLSDNLLLAARLCPGLTRLDLLRLQRHALDAAFVSSTQRRVLLRSFNPTLT